MYNGKLNIHKDPLIKKKEAVSKAIVEGKNFKKHLAYKKYMFVFQDTYDNKFKSLELSFHPRNYMHLTGLILVDNNGEPKRNSAMEFYKKCTEYPFLTESDVKFSNPDIIDLKMNALQYLSQIGKLSKIEGLYNQSKPIFKAAYLLGNNNFVLGTDYDTNRHTYFPKSILRENIRELITRCNPIIAIFEKSLTDIQPYKIIKFADKKFDLTKLDLPKEITNKISLENYQPPKHNKNFLISGAMNKEIIDIRSDKAFKYAVKSYDKIRKNKKDIELIANNTNLSIDAIKLVKNYLFMDKHIIGNKERRFAPCFEIAKSWYRLAFDKEHITPHDLMLLKHELVEIQYVSMGMNQNIAHRKTLDEGYNYMIEAHKYYFPEKTQNLVNIDEINNDLNISKEENIDIDDDYEMEY